MHSLSLIYLLEKLRKDCRGSIGFITGLLLVPMVGGVGFGIDYTRAVTYKMRLDAAASAATLAAVEAARTHLELSPNATPQDIAAAGQKRLLEVFNARAPKSDASYFTHNILVERVGDTITTNVEYSGSVNTTVASIFAIKTIQVSGSARSNGPVRTGGTQTAPADPDVLFRENFTENLGVLERGGRSWGLRTDYNNWKTPAGAIEIGIIERAYKAERPPSGSTNALELDSTTNTSISRKLYLPVGSYDLRYWIRDRVRLTDYDPAWLCGNRKEALIPPGVPNFNDTNRVETYLDLAPNDTPPQGMTANTHNMIDACLMTGGRWIERQFTINVKAPGYFWLTFQARGKSDSYGALITDIQLCKVKCKEDPNDNFPWAPNTLLFSDSFETATGSGRWTERTIDYSGTNHGWPRLPTGWTTWPENQLDYTDDWPRDGLLRIGLDATKSALHASNRGISRRFIFTPGYYQLTYFYRSAANLSISGTWCGVPDVTTQTTLLTYMNTSKWPADTNLLRVYVDPDAMHSSPYHEPVLRATAKWQDPGGGPATLPNLPATVIDACVHASAWVQRDVRFKISKSGFYWLTFRAEGTPDEWGAALDDFKMVALGGLNTQVTAAVAVPFLGELQSRITVGGIEVVSN